MVARRGRDTHTLVVITALATDSLDSVHTSTFLTFSFVSSVAHSFLIRFA
jgi:hypothetical protein